LHEAGAPNAAGAPDAVGSADAAPAASQPPGSNEDEAAPAVEAVAQLEAEVEYKRQQVAAQLVELRDREQRLRTTAAELERARRDVAALRGELEESRAAATRFERTIIDKDRALEARDARIASLQEEIKQRAGDLERLSSIDFSRPEVPANGRQIPSGDRAAAPALVCLTGDAPKRVVLTDRSLTIGRGPHCDLQILTHFVSREHARISLVSGHALIEDIGSRNGVFVNSVRIDRQELQHGDLITIGDTQFRFVESVAH
jgi:hypothetical protein